MYIHISAPQPQLGFSKSSEASTGIGRRWITLWVGLTQAVALSGCAAVPSASVVPPSATQALAALRSAVGEAPCTHDSQCHSVAIGARPCGGPEGYTSWSEQTTDAQQIAVLAASYTAARKAENARSGMASDCRFIPDPGAVCRPKPGGGAPTCQPGDLSQGNEGRDRQR